MIPRVRAGTPTHTQKEPTPMKTTPLLPITLTDGGRAEAGYKGTAGDCVTRAVAVATGSPYADVYKLMHEAGNKHGSKSAARTGVPPAASGEVMREHFGWHYISYATGGAKYLTAEDMPDLPAFCAVLTRPHWVAVVGGVVHDTWDSRTPKRGRPGRSRVAGLWVPGDWL